MKLGITCQAGTGGSGILATELGQIGRASCRERVSNCV